MKVKHLLNVIADRCYIQRLVSSPDPTLVERKGLVTIMHEE